MEEKKQGKGLVVALVLFILTTLVACGYIVYDKVLTKDKNITKEASTKKEKVEEKELDINSDLVQNLYNTFNIIPCDDELKHINDNKMKLIIAYKNIPIKDRRIVNCSEVGALYEDGDIEYCGDHNELGVDDRMNKAYEKGRNSEEFKNYINETNTTGVDNSVMERKVKELFGSDYEYKPESFGLSTTIEPYCALMKYDENNKLYAHYTGECGGTCGPTSGKIVSAKLKNDILKMKLTIEGTDKVLIYEFKKDKELLNYVFKKAYFEEK